MRKFLAAVLLLVFNSFAHAQIVTVAVTFDNYVTTYNNAFFDMIGKGLTGTFFVDADHIGAAGQPTRDNLVLMAAQGWEIGARVYGTISGAEANMVAVYLNNRGIALDRLKAQKVAMSTLGFDIESIAASQRAWSTQLEGLSRHLFKNVRVVDNTPVPPSTTIIWQSYPIPNRLYIRDGASNSLSASDTATSLCGQLNALIADAVSTGNGKAWTVLVHKVSDPASADPNYTVSFTEFQGFTTCLRNAVLAGTARVVRFRDLVTPP
jgi:hypothetical protein